MLPTYAKLKHRTRTLVAQNRSFKTSKRPTSASARSERGRPPIDERYYARRPNDIIDRINHRLSRPLGNLVPTRYKVAFRLGALLLVLGGAAMADEPRRRRR